MFKKYTFIAYLFSLFFVTLNYSLAEENTHVTAIKKAQNSVVSIYVYPNDSVDMEANYSKQKISLGSGVVFEKSGYIVTNNHVTKEREKVLVEFLDGSVYVANVVERNSIADLVLLLIQGADRPFQSISIADSDSLELGEQVIAIGNPFGIGISASSGIVSAITPRTSGLITSYVGTLVQTDAATNPGNSGGPLVNIKGELIGINNSIFSRKGEFNGISLAIPSNVAALFFKKAVQGDSLRNMWIGASVLGLDQLMVEELQLNSTQGVIVSDVYEQGPASKAKLRKGDVILSINGNKIKNQEHFVYLVASLDGNVAYDLTFYRQGKVYRTKIALELPPENPIRNLSPIPFVAGLTIANSSPATAIEISYSYRKKGIVVYEVATRSSPYKLGIRSGDFVSSINGKKVKTVSEFLNYFKQNIVNVDSGAPLVNSFTIGFLRGNDEYEITFEVK